MDVKLKIVGGAKTGAEIPLKRDKFTIGRSAECSLRAGSDAISRKHCMIRVRKAQVSIKDLGSRNGTYVNGDRIEKEVVLRSGDEVRVGPLRFEIVALHGIDQHKEPHIQDVAEAAARTASKAQNSRDFEENVDEWLTEPTSDSRAMQDTTSLRFDETHGGAPQPAEETETVAESMTGSVHDDDAVDTSASTSDEAASSSIIRKRKGKKEPGKLPDRPKGPTSKDSREAAAEVLRAMTRRR